MRDAPVFELRGIVKDFPGVRALDGVSFTCRAGEVHGLAGENGAGKSTLMKVLSGVYRADEGEIVLGGETRRFAHPVEALRAGISVIYQEFSLLPDRTVAQNVFLGREPRRAGALGRLGLVDTARMRRETDEVMARFGTGHRIRADALVGELSVAEQQVVEIAKALSWDARVIVMDEPTAALNERECEDLFALIDGLREEGRAIVYITHRMRELTRLATRVTVLKDGAVAAAFDAMPEPGAVIAAMVGREVGDFYPAPATPDEIGAPVLSVRGGGNARLHGIDLDLRAGEIVGFAGLQGAGREALAMALFGETPFERGTVSIDGQAVTIASPRDAIAARIAMLPGDRKGQALVLMQSVLDNAILTARAVANASGSPRRNAHAGTERIEALLREVDLRAAGTDVEVGSLSGGNQQKVVVARWLALHPRVLVFVEPTRGIDVNAKAGIYRLMRELARGGAAVMMVSSDLPEVLGASDRVLVMSGGRIVAEFPRGVGEAEVMHAAVGTGDDATARADRVAA